MSGCIAGRYDRVVIERMTAGSVGGAADAAAEVEGRLLRRLSADDVPNREAIKTAILDLGERPGDERLQAAVQEQVERALAADAGLRSD